MLPRSRSDEKGIKEPVVNIFFFCQTDWAFTVELQRTLLKDGNIHVSGYEAERQLLAKGVSAIFLLNHSNRMVNMTMLRTLSWTEYYQAHWMSVTLTSNKYAQPTLVCLVFWFFFSFSQPSMEHNICCFTVQDMTTPY